MLTIGSGSGCSFLFVDPPPPNHAALPYFDCTSSRWAPNTDIVIAGLFAAAAVARWSDRPQSSAETEDLIGTSLLGGGFVAAAVSGWTKTHHCREAKSALAARINELWRGGWRGGAIAADPWQNLGPAPAVPRPAPAPVPVPLPAETPPP